MGNKLRIRAKRAPEDIQENKGKEPFEPAKWLRHSFGIVHNLDFQINEYKERISDCDKQISSLQTLKMNPRNQKTLKIAKGRRDQLNRFVNDLILKQYSIDKEIFESSVLAPDFKTDYSDDPETVKQAKESKSLISGVYGISSALACGGYKGRKVYPPVIKEESKDFSLDLQDEKVLEGWKSNEKGKEMEDEELENPFEICGESEGKKVDADNEKGLEGGGKSAEKVEVFVEKVESFVEKPGVLVKESSISIENPEMLTENSKTIISNQDILPEFSQISLESQEKNLESPNPIPENLTISSDLCKPLTETPIIEDPPHSPLPQLYPKLNDFDDQLEENEEVIAQCLTRLKSIGFDISEPKDPVCPFKTEEEEITKCLSELNIINLEASQDLKNTEETKKSYEDQEVDKLLKDLIGKDIDESNESTQPKVNDARPSRFMQKIVEKGLRNRSNDKSPIRLLSPKMGIYNKTPIKNVPIQEKPVEEKVILVEVIENKSLGKGRKSVFFVEEKKVVKDESPIVEVVDIGKIDREFKTLDNEDVGLDHGIYDLGLEKVVIEDGGLPFYLKGTAYDSENNR